MNRGHSTASAQTRATLRAKQSDKIRRGERTMAHFYGVTDRLLLILDPHPRAARHTFVMLAGQLCCRATVTRQQFEKGLKALGIEPEIRRKLPQQRAKLMT
jgi:hypothetical protein